MIDKMHQIGVFHRILTFIKFNPEERAANLKRFREFYSREAWDVRAFTYEGSEPTGPNTWARNDINKFIADGHTGGFDPHFRLMLGGKKSGGGKACGQGEHGGNEAVCYDEFGCESDTTEHESMHNGWGNGKLSYQGKGLGHAHEINSKGEITAMGDWSGLMGLGSANALSAANICIMEWNKPEQTIVIEDNAQVLIAPVPMEGLFANEYKYVIVRREGFNDFYLSLMQDSPYDCGDAKPDSLLIHEHYPDGTDAVDKYEMDSTVRYPDLLEKNVRVLPNGVEVRYESIREGIARVTVLFPQSETGYTIPVAEDGLPVFGAPVQSGCYFNPVSNGHGFDVHTHGDTTVIYVYTTDEKTRKPMFLLASGIPGAELDLIRMVGGTTNDPTTAYEVVVGSCTFTGNVFAYTLHGRRSGMEVIPLVIPITSDIYYYEPRDGEGLTVQEYEGGCAAFFYSYTWNNAVSSDTWYSCEGRWNGEFYDCVVYRVEGQPWCYTKPQQVGTAHLFKLEDGSVRLHFMADNRDETYVMEKLFNG